MYLRPWICRYRNNVDLFAIVGLPIQYVLRLVLISALLMCGLSQVGDPKYIFEAKTIMRMELLVLSTLKWRMQAYTPCSFIDYFLSKINDDKHPLTSSISRSVQVILGTIRGLFLTMCS